MTHHVRARVDTPLDTWLLSREYPYSETGSKPHHTVLASGTNNSIPPLYPDLPWSRNRFVYWLRLGGHVYRSSPVD